MQPREIRTCFWPLPQYRIRSDRVPLLCYVQLDVRIQPAPAVEHVTARVVSRVCALERVQTHSRAPRGLSFVFRDSTIDTNFTINSRRSLSLENCSNVRPFRPRKVSRSWRRRSTSFYKVISCSSNSKVINPTYMKCLINSHCPYYQALLSLRTWYSSSSRRGGTIFFVSFSLSYILTPVVSIFPSDIRDLSKMWMGRSHAESSRCVQGG